MLNEWCLKPSRSIYYETNVRACVYSWLLGYRYIVPERSTMRIQYQRTLQKMHNESKRCMADNAQRAAAGKSARWCPDRVVPWISLGAGYKPSENLTQSTSLPACLPTISVMPKGG